MSEARRDDGSVRIQDQVCGARLDQEGRARHREDELLEPNPGANARVNEVDDGAPVYDADDVKDGDKAAALRVATLWATCEARGRRPHA